MDKLHSALANSLHLNLPEHPNNSMKTLRILILLLVCAGTQLPAFSQSVTSNADLTHYLSRSVTDSRLRDFQPPERQQEYDFLQRIDAKFIGRAVGLWGGEDAVNNSWWWPSVTNMCSDLKATYIAHNQGPPILQATIFEIITPKVNNVEIPQYVLDEYYPATAPNAPRNFIQTAMRFDKGFRHHEFGTNNAVPDMSKTETQMYFYFMATKYIDAGINAIHFGQVKLMDDNDPGYFAWWDMLSRVRAYAAAQGTFVLCDAHTHGAYYSPFARAYADILVSFWNLDIYLDLSFGKGIDLNDAITYSDNSSLQLLFDFHSSPTRPDEIGTAPYNGDHRCKINAAFGIYNKSKGGISPFLGYYTELPYLAEIDNYGGIAGSPGVSNPAEWDVWGWDEITWYYLQSNSYLNYWIPYAYCAIQKIDAHGFFQVPVKRGACTTGAWPCQTYRANPNQETAIKNAWDAYDAPLVAPSIYEVDCYCLGHKMICEFAHTGNDCYTTYSWSGGPSIVVGSPGWYTVTIQATKNGATVSQSMSVYKNPNDCEWGGPVRMAPQAWQVSAYPNPASDQLNLEMTGGEETRYSMVDLSGKVLRTWKSTAASQQIDLSEFPNGTYVLLAEAKDEAIFRKKIVVMR